MASKRKSNKTPKPYPVQRCIPLTGFASPFALGLLRGPQALSKVNYRLMRETRMYRMKVDLTAPISGGVKVYALRKDWGMRGAITMAHRMWMAATKEERKAGGLSKWYDFRLDYGVGENVTPTPHVALLNPLLTSTVTTSVSTPSGAVNITNPGEVQYTDGEFAPSEVVSEDTGLVKTFTLSATPLSSQWSVLQEFSLRGNADDGPQPETDTPYAGLMATMDPAAALHLQGDGDEPPYNGNSFGENSPWVHVATLRSDSNGRKMTTGFIDAPCGVLMFGAETGLIDVDDHDLCVEFQAGDYKGVKSWPLI